MRLLIVEDDEVIGDRTRLALVRDGYHVDWALDGEEGLRMARAHPYHLIILDVMMPKMDGFQVVQELRNERDRVPILMLTARDATTDRVKGLDTGADDYLIKPFDFSELTARIRALLRRDKPIKSSVIHVADLAIDTLAKTVERDGEPIHLTKREYTLLEALAQNQGRVLSRDTIIERVWDDDQSLSNTVNFHVTSLRKKIDADRDGSLIETVHGLGYRLVSPARDGA